jgi:putative endonuclease
MINKAARSAYWAYMVECKYGTYYAGWTNDLTKRIAAHNKGTGAKYLRGKGPVKLVYKKKFSTALKAQAHERFLKSLTRKEKESVIANEAKQSLKT